MKKRLQEPKLSQDCPKLVLPSLPIKGAQEQQNSTTQQPFAQTIAPHKTGTPQGKNRKQHPVSCKVGPKPNIPPIEVASFNVLTEVAHSRRAIQTDHCVRKSHFILDTRKSERTFKGTRVFSSEEGASETPHILPSLILTTQKKKGKFDVRTLIQAYFQA